jgi:hypothetical protein
MKPKTPLFFMIQTQFAKMEICVGFGELQNLGKQLNENGVMSRRYEKNTTVSKNALGFSTSQLHSEPMAGGTTVLNDVSEANEWTGIPPRTIAAIMLKIVCSN